MTGQSDRPLMTVGDLVALLSDKPLDMPVTLALDGTPSSYAGRETEWYVRPLWMPTTAVIRPFLPQRWLINPSRATQRANVRSIVDALVISPSRIESRNDR